MFLILNCQTGTQPGKATEQDSHIKSFNQHPCEEWEMSAWRG